MATLLKMPIVTPEYPGYLESYPRSEQWVQEIDENNQAIFDRLKSIYGAKNVHIIGRSLGTTFASKLSSVNQCNRLIVISPFEDLKAVAKNKVPMPGLSMFFTEETNHSFSPQTDNQVYIVYGTNDTLITP